MWIMCIDASRLVVSCHIVLYRVMVNQPLYSKLHTFLLNGDTNISGIFLLQ